MSNTRADLPALEVQKGRAGWLSRYARGRKLEYFFSRLPKEARILDVGCAAGWVKAWATANGWHDITGIDLNPPADVVGDVRDWQRLGLEERSFDAIVAFEVVEHGDLAAALRQLLRPGGRLLATTPVPHLDWVCQVMEAARVLQRRTGPHTHLVDLRHYPGFRVLEWSTRGGISQWGVLTPD